MPISPNAKKPTKIIVFNQRKRWIFKTIPCNFGFELK
jgi:hypothetical protein